MRAGSPGRRPENPTSKSTPETYLTVSITSSTEKPRAQPQVRHDDRGDEVNDGVNVVFGDQRGHARLGRNVESASLASLVATYVQPAC
jgi:hypothetical protein